MWLLLIGALILATPFVLKAHYAWAAERLRAAPVVWDALEKYARVLLEDRHLNPDVGDFVEFTLKEAGSGGLTRTFFRALFLHSLRSPDDSHTAELFNSLNREQEQQLYRFMVAAMLYDSLCTSLSGWVLRRALYWMTAAATDRSVPVSRAQVQPMVSAADRLCHNHA